MKIKQAEFTCSAVKNSQFPSERLPEIALAGRSNAGKSSLINALIQRKNLAHTSSAPGKTRLLNFYRVAAAASGDEMPLNWYFVDLPGYGYAKAARSERDRWLAMIEAYLQSEGRRMVWQLVDIRHEPSALDIAMHQILVEAGLPTLVIANKADKISKNARVAAKKTIAAALGVKNEELAVFSAVTRDGRDELLARAESFLLPPPLSDEEQGE